MISIMIDWIRSLPQQQRTYEEGQHLFHRNDPVRSMFFIEEGTAQLIRHHRDGSAAVLQRAGPGSMLAEASLFASAYHCDAVAIEPVTATLIARRSLRRLFVTSPDFAQAWAAHLSAEVRHARTRAEILSLRTIAQRLDAWIAETGSLPDKGSWKSLALEIAVSPEALYREIARRRQ